MQNNYFTKRPTIRLRIPASRCGGTSRLHSPHERTARRPPPTEKSSDIRSQKQPLRPLYVATLTPLTEHFPSPFPDVRQWNAISRMEQFTTMDTRSGNTATAVSGFTERLSSFNFPQQSRLPNIAHQNPFLPHLQHNPNTVIPTQTLPLFQLKHSRHNHAYKASQTLSP